MPERPQPQIRRRGRSRLIAAKGKIVQVDEQRCSYCGELTAPLYPLFDWYTPDACRDCFKIGSK